MMNQPLFFLSLLQARRRCADRSGRLFHLPSSLQASANTSGIEASPPFLVFNRFAGQASANTVTVWRIGADGSNPVQLSSGKFDAFPACSLMKDWCTSPIWSRDECSKPGSKVEQQS